MYSVSEQYKTAMKQPVQRFRMTGNVGKYSFDDSNILKGSFHLTNQCSDDTNISIGSVYIGELKVTLMNMPFVRGTLDDLEIRPSLGLLLPSGKYEDIPLGVFHVSSADWGESGVAITAYDNMAKFDKNIAISGMGTTSLYHFLLAACNACGVRLGMEEAEVNVLPNGSEQLSLFADNDIETWRDLVSWCAMTAGCFATMNREGMLILRKYTDTPVDTIDMEHRFSGGRFSDFTTRYTGISIVNISDQTTKYYGLMPDDGLTFNMGQNPFIQYGVQEVLDRQRRAVLNALSVISYVPMEVGMIGNPIYDLGDVLLFSGGIAGKQSLSCITKYDWTYNGEYKATCVGQDPALSTAKSKVDKNIAGLLSNVSEDSMHYYDYRNAEEITIEDGKRAAVIQLKYATVKATHIDFHAEVLLSLATTELDASDTFHDMDGVLTVTYYLNGEEVSDYYPVETLQDGGHVLHLLYTWTSTANVIGNFDVTISVAGCSVVIKEGNARAYMAGQGLAGEGAWDGNLNIEDEVPPQKVVTILRKIGSSVDILMPQGNDCGLHEAIPSFRLSSVLRSIGGMVGDAKMLHRFDTYHDGLMTYDRDKVEIQNNRWQLKEGVDQAELVTPDEPAEQILRVTAKCDSNNVNFLASFDHGGTWWTYENGWTKPDTTKDIYGMFGPLMGVVTKDEWAEKLNGTIQMKIIIHGTGHLTDLQIFTKEVPE